MMGGVSRFLVASTIFLAAGASQLRAASEPEPLNAYVVKPTRMVILPVGDEHLDIERTISPDDVIMTSDVGYAETARLTDARDVTIADRSETIRATRPLFKVDAKGGEMGNLPKTAIVYCASDHYDGRPDVGAALTLGLSRLGNRLGRETRLCLVDGDADGRFERAFLVGTNFEADRRMVAVDPVGYVTLTNEAIPSSELRIVYRKGALLQGAVLQMELTVLGKQRDIVGLRPFIKGKHGKEISIYAGLRSATYPHDVKFGDVHCVISSFDSTTKQASLSCDHGFSYMPVDLDYAVHTIYVYVPAVR